MQMGHIYFKHFLFMQGNLNNIKNAVLMHFDVDGNDKVMLSLLATLDIYEYYKNVLNEKLLGINYAMTLEGIDCKTIKFVILYFRMLLCTAKN